VEFLSNGAPVTWCGGARGKPLGRSGIVTCAVIFGRTGARNIVAQYLGANLFSTSTSLPLLQIVTPQPCKALAGCNLSGLDLENANLQGANLTLTNLRGANLSGADLQGANLTNTNFSGADLAKANLHGAKLTHTKFTGANLRGTHF
jgi:uncharacterized protein YjbI with pentapeptide repeats